PLHPYSLGLQQAFPNLAQPKDILISIEGYPPDLHQPPVGCRFAQRCPFVLDKCREQDPMPEVMEAAHLTACWRAGEMERLRQEAQSPERWRETEAARIYGIGAGAQPISAENGSARSDGDAPLLEVRGLSKRYQIGGGLAGLIRG